MPNKLQQRRLNLLWHGVQLAGNETEGYAELGGGAARAAGYQDTFGEGEYMQVFELDIQHLLDEDKAVEIDYAHTMHGVGGFVAYRLTPEGRQMLFDEGYPVTST